MNDFAQKNTMMIEPIDKKLTSNLSSAWWVNEEREETSRIQREKQNASGKMSSKKRKGRSEAKIARLQHQEAVSK